MLGHISGRFSGLFAYPNTLSTGASTKIDLFMVAILHTPFVYRCTNGAHQTQSYLKQFSCNNNIREFRSETAPKGYRNGIKNHQIHGEIIIYSPLFIERIPF